MDLAFSLQGVQANWRSATDSNRTWEGRLPVLDLEVAKSLTSNSPSVSKLWSFAEGPGTITLATQLNPTGLFYPSVQTGSKLDYDPDQDKFLTYTGFELQSENAFSWGHSEDDLRLAYQECRISCAHRNHGSFRKTDSSHCANIDGIGELRWVSLLLRQFLQRPSWSWVSRILCIFASISTNRRFLDFNRRPEHMRQSEDAPR